MTLLEDWAAESRYLSINEYGKIRGKNNRAVAQGDDDRVIVYKDGGMALQGEPLEIRDNDGTPTLIVEGTRHAWDEGPVEFEGQFAVFGDRHLDIDGPLPEASQV